MSNVTDTVDPAALDAILASIFMTPEGKADPYPGYATVREAGPLHHSAFGIVVLSRYADCMAVLRDPRCGRGEQLSMEQLFGLTSEEVAARFPRIDEQGSSMLGADPPDHTRLRALVSKAFTPRTVERLRPRIQARTDELLSNLEGEVDVMPELALRLPITVIGEMLGVPQSDHAALLPPIRIAIRSLANFGPPDLDSFEEIYRAGDEINDYFKDLAARRRSHPEDDMLTGLVHAEEEGDKLSEPELLATITLLFVAGYETTTNLIGNGLYALLRHPAQLQRLRRDPTLVRPAVEEMLRYDSPVQLTGRAVLDEGVEVGGAPLPKGTQLVTLFGAANRDPRVFSDPDTFDVGRSEHAPISFSAGIHYCLGAALARAEGDVVFASLLDRFSTIEPAWASDSLPTYRDNVVLRGLERLPVRLLPA